MELVKDCMHPLELVSSEQRLIKTWAASFIPAKMVEISNIRMSYYIKTVWPIFHIKRGTVLFPLCVIYTTSAKLYSGGTVRGLCQCLLAIRGTDLSLFMRCFQQKHIQSFLWYFTSIFILKFGLRQNPA